MKKQQNMRKRPGNARELAIKALQDLERLPDREMATWLAARVLLDLIDDERVARAFERAARR